VLKLGGSKDEVNFSNEEMCLCYSNITVDNFLITKADQIYVIDFGDTAFLPSFMSFVLHGGMKPLTKRISNKVASRSRPIMVLWASPLIFSNLLEQPDW
jgi:hypothetical protein